MVITLVTAFAGKRHCLPMYRECIEELLSHTNADFKYVIYDNSADKDFGKDIREWADTLGVEVIYYQDLQKPHTIENTSDYALTSQKVALNYKVIFSKLLPPCDYVFCLEDDTTCEADAIEQLLGTLGRNPKCVTAIGSVYGRRLNDRYFGVPVVFAFKLELCYPTMINFVNKASSHRIPERESGEEIIGSGHVACWLTKYEVIKEMGWEVSPDVGVAGDISWGYRLWQQGRGIMMINWGVKCKHWFLDENKQPDYYTFGKTGGMPLQFLGEPVKTGSPTFRNGVQITK
jgi:hypothetical protein